MHPHFVFTDKESAQIAAIQAVWGPSRARLCFWHMQQAILRRLKLKKVNRLPTNLSIASVWFPFIAMNDFGQNLQVELIELLLPYDNN
jgi:hypothetical protein